MNINFIGGGQFRLTQKVLVFVCTLSQPPIFWPKTKGTICGFHSGTLKKFSVKTVHEKWFQRYCSAQTEFNVLSCRDTSQFWIYYSIKNTFELNKMFTYHSWSISVPKVKCENEWGSHNMYLFVGCKISPYLSHRYPKVEIRHSSAATSHPQSFLSAFFAFET